MSARILAAVLLVVPLIAHAAGLGKLNVLSALGRPLNAEIEVLSVPRGDIESLSARIASNEAFRQAGIEFNPALLSIRMTVERRGEGAVVKLTSSQPINEPFLDVLIELQWASGRLVREYTFLLDPPGYTGPQIIASVPAAGVMKPEPAAPPAGESPMAAPSPALAPISPPAMTPPRAEEASAPPAETSSAVPAAAPVVAASETPSEPAAIPVTPETRLEERPLMQETTPAPAEAEKPSMAAMPVQDEPERELSYEVKRGDTLSEIAQRHFVAGVTLNQMLIALYRENESAFIRNNVNLVREGRILTIPKREAIAAIDPDEARQLVLSHMADFGRYRAAIAAAAAQRRGEVAAVEQTSGGQIETRPERPAPAGPKDQVKLSKADPARPSAAASKAAREDDTAARERALQEAQSRVTDLEKNVLDLRKLLELKNQQLAELEKRAAGKAPEPAKAAAPVPPVTAQVVQTPKPAAAPPVSGQAAPQPVMPAQKAPEPPKPAPVAAPVASPPTAAGAPSPVAKAPEPIKPAPVPPQAPEAAKPVEPPKPKPAAKPVPPPPPPAPSFVDEFLENPVALAGLGAVFIILLGYGAWAWRRKKAAQSKFQDSVLGPISAAAGASSVFGPAQKAAAAGPSSVVLPSVSQASVGGMETDEVDPIAEADVYMAYGRDAQAEEILREALDRDGSRTAIHEKLLEIYANRRDPKAFEQVALKLKEITGGAGPDWDKAVALGRSIDAQNSLYGGTGRSASAPAMATAAAASGVDFDLDAGVSAGGTPDLLLGTGVEEPALAAGSVDIDLGAAEPSFTPEGTMIVESAESRAASGGLDLDLGREEEAKPASDGIDFELPSTSPEAEASVAHAPSSGAGGGVDFDLQLDLGETRVDASADTSETSAGAGPLDLSSISLDLGGTPEGEGALGSTDPKWQEVATKLDLAKAYEEMGDKNGASELLNEVLREGDGAQRSQAQELLAKLT